MNILKKIAKKIYHVVNALIRRGRWFNESKFPDCRKFWTYNTFNTEVVNLGSTSGLNAFSYEGLPIKGANWALRRNPLGADFAILKNYESFLCPTRCTCIISLCPFSSLSGSYDFQEDRYYTLLYPTSIPHFSYRKQQEVKAVMNAPLLYFPLFAVFSDFISIIRKRVNRTLNEAEMRQDANRWMNDWFKEFSIRDLNAPLSLINKDGIEDAANILNEMILFCKVRNIRPAIVIPPMYKTLADKFTPTARMTIIDSLIDKVDDKNIYYYNYMDDVAFTNDATLFQNSFLMNKKGAKLFTKRVLEDLNIL